MKHWHHIVPKHMGGTDSESNLVLLTVEEHAEAHRLLYEKHGLLQDYLAWKGLAGLMNKQEITQTLLKEAGRKGAIKGNANRKGMKYKPYTRTKGSTTGLKWYYNPEDVYERGCFMEDTQPNGWVRGQGKKKVNPGNNFHAKRNKSC